MIAADRGNKTLRIFARPVHHENASLDRLKLVVARSPHSLKCCHLRFAVKGGGGRRRRLFVAVPVRPVILGAAAELHKALPVGFSERLREAPCGGDPLEVYGILPISRRARYPSSMNDVRWLHGSHQRGGFQLIAKIAGGKFYSFRKFGRTPARTCDNSNFLFGRKLNDMTANQPPRASDEQPQGRWSSKGNDRSRSDMSAGCAGQSMPMAGSSQRIPLAASATNAAPMK